mgnify:CR=1 FL=1
MKFAGLVWSNLKRRKLRTALTILSVLVAFLLFGFLGAIKQALVGGVDLSDANRLIVRHRVSIIQMLPLAYMDRIGRIPGVVSVTPFIWFNGIYQDPKNFFGSFPVDPVGLLDMYPEISLPAAQRKAWLETRTGAGVWCSALPADTRHDVKANGSHFWYFPVPESGVEALLKPLIEGEAGILSLSI